MNKNEKALFFELCKFQNSDKEKIKELIAKGAATPNVLGHLFSNRMAAVAYGVLLKNDLLSVTDREFRNSLKIVYLMNKQQNESYFSCLRWLSRKLKDCEGKYALLKGAYLCRWYPVGYRTSNDIDILVEAQNVTLIGDRLTEAGFKQGHIYNDKFVPANRVEIISSKMMRGETVPYIKEVNLPGIRYLEVDINFSLDYKNSKDSSVSHLISRAGKTTMNGMEIITLEKYDFLIHLCGHLYKEATTYPWIKMKRDLTLYKFCDLYALLSNYKAEDFINLEKRLSEFNMEDICYYALFMTRELFDINESELDDFLNRIQVKNKNILNYVTDPAEKKEYQYEEKDIRKRFFSNDRTRLLKEVRKNAQA